MDIKAKWGRALPVLSHYPVSGHRDCSSDYASEHLLGAAPTRPSAMMALPRPDVVDGRPTHRLLDPALLRPARARRALPTGQDA
jgi:hypothetical protein